MHKQHANESFIEYECWLNKQNNYACKKYVEEFFIVQKWLEQLKIYIQNQHVIETKEENAQRLHMLAYFESLDAENVIGLVQSPHLHKIYDMVKLCLSTRIYESICVVCDNLVPISSLHKYFPYEILLEFMRWKLQPFANLPPSFFNLLCTSTPCKILEGMLLSIGGI